jgi:hypothetical protein
VTLRESLPKLRRGKLNEETNESSNYRSRRLALR